MPLASSCTALPRPQRTPDFALGADHICWLEGSGAILAEVVCVVVVFRGSKHGENLVNLGGEEVLWEKQLQEVEDMLKISLGEVGSDEEDEEDAPLQPASQMSPGKSFRSPSKSLVRSKGFGISEGAESSKASNNSSPSSSLSPLSLGAEALRGKQRQLSAREKERKRKKVKRKKNTFLQAPRPPRLLQAGDDLKRPLTGG